MSPARYVRSGGVAVELVGGGGSAADQWPSGLLNDGVLTASSSRATVTAVGNVTPHTAGTWVEVDPSLSVDANGIYLYVNTSFSVAGTDTSTLIELGTGASGSEVAWATFGAGYAPGARVYFVPGYLAAGTRVAVRVRSAVASKSVAMLCQFLAEKPANPGAPVTYQADAATSRGLTITAPGSLNTKGAWTQLVGSTAAAFTSLLVAPQAAAGTVMSASGVLIDIGIGGAGSETVLIPDIHLLGSTSEAYLIFSPLTYGVDVPAGSRLSARYARATTGNAVDLIVVAA